MKRVSAAVVYTIGAFVCLRSVATALTQGSILIGLEYLMWALAMWWFAVGLGVRLGLEPSEYARGIAGVLGFRRPAEERQET